MTQKAEDEQNKGRAAGCGADDTSVLQEEGGQQGVMPWVQRTATVRYCKTGTLQVWREQAYMQEVPHPLLSSSDEGTNVQSDALGWPENDSASPGCCHQACHKRIVNSLRRCTKAYLSLPRSKSQKQMTKEVRIYIQYYDSPCGRLALASFADKLCLCDWSDNPFAERNRHRLEKYLKATSKTETTPVMEDTKRQLDEYFAGKRKAFEIQLRLVGTDFQHEVWNALRSIPYGATKSYKDIAQCIGKPKAVRAVAGAISANGISILIPCHRVIGSNHSLTGYAGGLEAKRMLLEMETQEHKH